MKLSEKEIDVFFNDVKIQFEKIYCKLLDKNDFEDFFKPYFLNIIKFYIDLEILSYKPIMLKISNNRRDKQNLYYKFVYTSFKNLNLNIDENEPKKDKASWIYERVLTCEKIQITSHVSVHIKLAYDYSQLFKDEFEKKFLFTNFDLYIKDILGELLNWALDNDEHICNFRYIKDFLSLKKIESSFKKDIELFLHRNIYEYLKNRKYTFVPILPINYIGKMPIDPSNKKTTMETQIKTDGNVINNYLVYVHEPNEYEKITTMIKIENNSQKVQSSKLFNLFDIDVIKALIKLAGDNFFKNQIIIKNFGEIVAMLPYAKTQQLYKDTFLSITKVSSFKSIYENSKNLTTDKFSIYEATTSLKNDFDLPKSTSDELLQNDMSSKIPKKYRNLVVMVQFSNKFVDGLIENAIFMDDKKSQSSLCNMAKALIIPLQSERYKCINEDNYNVKLGFNSFFNATLILGSLNKDRNLKNIDKALNEIIEIGDIIKSFYRISDFFYIEFCPLSSKEKNDLLEYIEHMTSIGTPLKLSFNSTTHI